MIKALLVGINEYPGSPLSGCVNDALDVLEYLTKTCGLRHEEILPLFDSRATKAAIVTALRDMIASSIPGDHLLFHYSGHGAQIASRDLNEPDGLDEVLCPVNFDWADPNTALTDNELGAILATVPEGTALTVVVDACHSGDISDVAKDIRKKKVTPRFLPPPPDVAFRLAGRTRVSRQRAFTRSNAVVVSACASGQTAADTSFDERPNGAFTYYWLAELGARSGSSVDAVVNGVTTSLERFQMNPEAAGLAELRNATFLCTPAPVSRAIASRGPATTIARGPARVVFEQGWTAKVLGMDLGVDLRISIQDAGLDFQLTSNSGVPLSWCFRIDGNTVQQVDLGYGFRLVLAVSGWTLGAADVDFDLAIRVAPPFFGPITIAREHVTVPLATAERSLVVPASPADLLALIQMAQMGPNGARPPTGSPTGRSRPRAMGEPVNLGLAWEHAFGGGLFGMSYNKNAYYELPNGYVRDQVEVVLDPPGSGNVYFVRWHDEVDETRASFEFHVGVSATWGGIARFFMIARPQVTINEPVVRQLQQPAATGGSKGVLAAPAATMNGRDTSPTNGQGTSRELEMETPEAGGSIRA